MSDHRLVDDTLVVVEGGIVGRCECGWTTGACFSSLVASVLFRDHVEDEAKKALAALLASQCLESET
jgi:hypothetical protein